MTGAAVKVWTDGSCFPNPGPTAGWAWCTADGRQASGRIGERESTNNRAELLAAIYAIEAHPDAEEIEVISDAKYIVDGGNSWVHNWARNGWRKCKANQDLWGRLYLLITNQRVRFTWVRGHSGDAMNELVEEERLKWSGKKKAG
jgi:ribonuclease HI